MTAQVLPETAREVRELIRCGQWRGVTSGVAPGHVQANLAILPRDLAFDFLLFCQRNPKPCPLLEVLEPGQTEPKLTAPGADIRTDLPAYRVYENGEFTAQVDSLVDYWREDLVSFLLGCSFSFETAMVEAGIPLRHHVHHQHRDGSGWSVLGAHGGQHEAGQTRPDSAGRAGHVPVPGNSRSAGAHRRPVGHRDKGPGPS